MIIYFLHCPRTGGNSFGRWLVKGKEKGIFNEINWNGHAGYNKKIHDEYKAKDLKTIVVGSMRDPVDLSASMYAYIKSAKNHGHHAETKKWNFAQWLENSKCHKNMISRFYFDPWTPLTDPPLDECIKVVKNFNYIFDTSTLTNDVNNMCKKEGISGHPFNISINGRSKPKVGKTEIDIIKRVCSVDYKLIAECAPHIKLKY